MPDHSREVADRSTGWVFATLEQAWSTGLDGTDATAAVEAQTAHDVPTWLLDNIAGSGTGHLGLAEGFDDTLRALAGLAANGPATRSAIGEALQTPIAAANLVARLRTLSDRLGRAGTVPGQFPRVQLLLLVLHRRRDCVSDGEHWRRKRRTTPNHYLLALRHQVTERWVWGLARPYARPTNLRRRPDGFHGRQHELARIAEGFGRTRLVTLVGPPGSGKTRLAEVYGLAPHPEHAATAGGVHLVDASGARTPESLLPLVVRRFGFDPGRSAQEQLPERVGVSLRHRGPVLLILDNLEHLCPEVTAWIDLWLRAAPRLRVLATSRVRLAHPVERAVEIGDLDVPGAVGMLIDRLGGGDAAAAAAVVDVLGGRPLFVELAARRAADIGLVQLVGELDHFGFDALRTGSPADPLDTTLRWSWQALDADAARMLARCTVFHGSFTAGTAAEVAEVTGAAPVLDELCEAHLVRRVHTPGPPRYRLLPAIQAFAARQLDDPDRARALHADALSRRMAGTVARSRGHDPVPPGERFLDEADLLAAWRWLAPRDPDRAALLAAEAARLMRAGHTLEAIEALLDRALALPIGPATRATLLLERAPVAALRNEVDLARSARCEAIQIARSVDDPWLLGECLGRVDGVHLRPTMSEAAERAAELREAIALGERLDYPLLVAKAKASLAMLPRAEGGVEAEARLLLEAAAILDATIGHRTRLTASQFRAEAYARLGDHDRALECARGAVAAAQSADVQSPISVCNAQSALARCLLASEHHGEAVAVLEATVEGFARAGHTGRVTSTRYNLCWAYLGAGMFEEAVELAEVVARSFAASGQARLADRVRSVRAIAAACLGDTEAVGAYLEDLGGLTLDQDPMRDERASLLALLAEPLAHPDEAAVRCARADAIRARSARSAELQGLVRMVVMCLNVLARRARAGAGAV